MVRDLPSLFRSLVGIANNSVTSYDFFLSILWLIFGYIPNGKSYDIFFPNILREISNSEVEKKIKLHVLCSM